MMHNFKAGKRIERVQENSVSAISTGSSSSFEANCNKIIKSSALGFYANTETSEESSMYAISSSMRRALIYADIFLSSYCSERRIFVLHLFSAFVWAFTEYVAVQDFHPASVREISPALSASPDSNRDKFQRSGPLLLRVRTILIRLKATKLKSLFKNFK